MSLFRYEKKYIVNRIQMEEFRMQIASICDTDPHAGGSGTYNIRSLYFDDYRDSSYYANMAGIEPRSKWRIRIYNYDSGAIFLEQKKKVQGKIQKESTNVTRSFCHSLLGDVGELTYPTENRIVNRFLTDCFTRELRPRIIIEYDREPYIYDAGDVRITFDKRICYSGQVKDFFDKDIFLCPIMNTGEQLLEVKYTELLPGFLHSMLNTGKLQQSTFSKYYLGRVAGRNLLYDNI